MSGFQIPTLESKTLETRKTHMTTRKGIRIICGTDVHGQSCGIVSYYVLRQIYGDELVSIYSHYRTPQDPRPSSLAAGLPDCLREYGKDVERLYIFDIPIFEEKGKDAEAAFKEVLEAGVDVWYIDHHGHNPYISNIAKMGVKTIIFGGAYDMAMYLPRMYDIVDDFVEKWAFIGAIADFDWSISWRVTRELESYVCEHLDQAMKTQRKKLMEVLNLPQKPEWGEAGSLIYGIVQKRVEPEEMIEAARKIVQPIELPPNYKVFRDIVVFLPERPKQYGLIWKLLWKATYVTQTKVGVAYGFDPQKKRDKIVIAKDWRFPEVIIYVEEFVNRYFAGKNVRIYGHEGAVSIEYPEGYQLTPEEVKQVAKDLAEFMFVRMLTGKVIHAISDETLARYLAIDYRQLNVMLNEIRELCRKCVEGR